jgi:hypothetical protein
VNGETVVAAESLKLPKNELDFALAVAAGT